MVPMGRHWRIGLTIILIGVFTEGVGGTVSGVAAASYSSSVQSHGIRATGTVALVYNPANAHESVTHPATMTVVLQSPASVEGWGPTVQVPGLIHYRLGQTVTVLVDPRDSSYAELPGDPNATLGVIAAPVMEIVISLTIGATWLRSALRRRRSERSREMDGNTGVMTRLGDV